MDIFHLREKKVQYLLFLLKYMYLAIYNSLLEDVAYKASKCHILDPPLLLYYQFVSHYLTI